MWCCMADLLMQGRQRSQTLTLSAKHGCVAVVKAVTRSACCLCWHDLHLLPNPSSNTASYVWLACMHACSRCSTAAESLVLTGQMALHYA